jgi:hypothetical protein
LLIKIKISSYPLRKKKVKPDNLFCDEEIDAKAKLDNDCNPVVRC